MLIRADLGASAALRIAEAVGKGRYDKNVSPEEVKTILAAEIETRTGAARASAGNRRQANGPS